MRHFTLVIQYLYQRKFPCCFDGALCFYRLSQLRWSLPIKEVDALFVFGLSFLAYNGIKYYPFKQKAATTAQIWGLFLAILAACYNICVFFTLTWVEQLLIFLGVLLCLSYSIPFPKAKKSLRSLFGVKIFIVAACWTILTAIFPLAKEGSFSWEHYLFFAERYLLIFIATLPFEINDYKNDETLLGTIPQQIGVAQTRWLGVGLLLVVVVLLKASPAFSTIEGAAMGAICLAYAAALFLIKPSSAKGSTLF